MYCSVVVFIGKCTSAYMDVSKKRGGTPKWMVKIMVPNPIKMDDLGVPLFLETPIYTCFNYSRITSFHCFIRFSHHPRYQVMLSVWFQLVSSRDPHVTLTENMMLCLLSVFQNFGQVIVKPFNENKIKITYITRKMKNREKYLKHQNQPPCQNPSVHVRDVSSIGRSSGWYLVLRNPSQRLVACAHWTHSWVVSGSQVV